MDVVRRSLAAEGFPAAQMCVTVLGCDTVGSAVACALHRQGFSVVLIDRADPPWRLRGMSYANAWFLGTSELDGVAACFCASVRSIPAVLSRRLIAATTWSWPAVLASLGASAIVDTRVEAASADAPTRTKAPDQGEHAHLLDLALDVSTAAAAVSASVDERCLRVAAKRSGRFSTSRKIGDMVHEGEVIGEIDGELVRAPAGGALRGLTARGARVERDRFIAEIDERGEPFRCFGLEPRARTIADETVDGLLAALAGSELAPNAPSPYRERLRSPRILIG